MSNSTGTTPPPRDPTIPIFTVVICGRCKGRHMMATFVTKSDKDRFFLSITCIACGFNFIMQIEEAVEHWSSPKPLLNAVKELNDSMDAMENQFA